MNPKATFITNTSKKYSSKENTPFGTATVPLPLVKVGMKKLKDQSQPLSYHIVELEIKELEKLIEAAETKHMLPQATS